MRSGGIPSLLALSTFFAVSVAVHAQTPSPCVSGAIAGGMMVYPSGHGKPWSATSTTTHDQKLLDGNSIHTVGVAHEVRSSTGKTMTEISVGCYIDEDGQSKPLQRVTVNDMQSRTMWSWSVGGDGEKVALVHHQPDPIPSKPLSPEVIQRRHAAFQDQKQREPIQREDLGTKMISGVLCLGTKTTTTIPPGQIGNELPVVTTHESWIAKDLGIMMLTVDDSPVNGKTTIEVTELKQGEPDPSVFEPPAGYTLVEQKTVTVTEVQ